jgi:Kef-type K+ transport system membrane component KefB
VPPIAAHSLLVLLLQMAVLLAAALALGRLAERFRWPAIAGELLAGVILGPSVLAHAAPPVFTWLFPADPARMGMLDAVGQLGVLLLVGVAGMGIDLGLAARQGSKAATVSAGGLLLPLAGGIAVSFLLPSSMRGPAAQPLVFAMFLGVALCVSAIPVIAKTLLEMNLLHRDIGQLIITAAVVDDFAGWLLLSIVSSIVAVGVSAGHILTAVTGLLAILVFTVAIGRPAVRGSLWLARRHGQPSVAVGIVVVLMLLAAAGTDALGMEPILGTLLCGMLVGAARRRREVPDLSALRTFVMAVLAPLFFATAGLRMDLTALRDPRVLLAGAGVLLVAVTGKFAGAYAGARISRLGHWRGLAVGAGLNARGVVEVVVATVGLRLHILTTSSYTVVILIAIVTSLMAPPLLRMAVRRLTETPAERERERVLAA